MRGKKRLQAAANCIAQLPVQHRAIDAAYARFLEDGTLPQDRTLAGAVLDRALHARKPVPELVAEQRALGLHQPYGTTREMLFREAVCSLEPARNLARLLLCAIVQAGYDPTDPEIIGPEMEPADFATVTMRLIGWPHDFVRPEYQRQLARVLRQQATVQVSRPRDDDEWNRGAGTALAAFINRDVVPTDSRYFLYVLTTGEEFALHAHYFGQGGEDLLAAYEAVATSTKAKKESALQRLGELQRLAGAMP